MFGMRDHVRRQVDAGRLMPLGCQQAGKEARARADIQHTQRLSLGEVFLKFRKPPLPLLAFIFAKALGLEAFGPV